MTLTRRRFLATSGSTALAFAAFGPGPFLTEAAAQQADAANVATPGPLPDHYLGQSNAPVTVIEYASMTCPHCATFHTHTFPQLKKDYIDTGKVRFVLREFPLDPAATAAFMLARCAAGDEARLGKTGEPVQPASADRYYALVDALFAQQRAWSTARNVEQSLLDLTKQAGFSQESFKACLTNQPLYEAVTATQDRAGKTLKVRSTPTFFVNGKISPGALSFAEISKLIDAELKS